MLWFSTNSAANMGERRQLSDHSHGEQAERTRNSRYFENGSSSTYFSRNSVFPSTLAVSSWLKKSNLTAEYGAIVYTPMSPEARRVLKYATFVWAGRTFNAVIHNSYPTQKHPSIADGCFCYYERHSNQTIQAASFLLSSRSARNSLIEASKERTASFRSVPKARVSSK